MSAETATIQAPETAATEPDTLPTVQDGEYGRVLLCRGKHGNMEVSIAWMSGIGPLFGKVYGEEDTLGNVRYDVITSRHLTTLDTLQGEPWGYPTEAEAVGGITRTMRAYLQTMKDEIAEAERELDLVEAGLRPAEPSPVVVFEGIGEAA